MKHLDQIVPQSVGGNIFRTSSPISSSAESAAAGPTSQSDSGRRERLPAAHTQPQPAPCPLCGGAGFVLRDLPVGHPDFGQPLPCQCRAADMATRKAGSLQRLSSLAGLDRFTFATFQPEPVGLRPEKTRSVRAAYESCRHFAARPEGWLVITGTYGSGKTHLAAAIANARLSAGQEALFVVVPDLLDHLRSTFGPHSEVSYDELFEQVRSTPLLILDDLGTQSGSPWAQEKLFQLLNHRYNTQLPTVITTNQRLEDLDQRLRSRLLDINLVNRVAITAPDFRAGANPSQSELSTLNLHRSQTLFNFDARRQDLASAERTNLQNTFNLVENYARDPHGWLVITGTYGCGKTHLAAAIANCQIAEGQTDVMFVVVPDFLDHLRAAFSPQSVTPYDRRFDEVKKAPLLVLDDLGTESATPWAREKLFQLLNYRYNAVLPTVITTSSGPNELEPWLRTCMLDVKRCQLVAITAPGYRGSQSQRQVTPRGRRTAP